MPDGLVELTALTVPACQERFGGCGSRSRSALPFDALIATYVPPSRPVTLHQTGRLSVSAHWDVEEAKNVPARGNLVSQKLAVNRVKFT